MNSRRSDEELDDILYREAAVELAKELQDEYRPWRIYAIIELAFQKIEERILNEAEDASFPGCPCGCS